MAMTHDAACDLTVYGPEAKGVFCTCDAPLDDEPKIAAEDDRVASGPSELLIGDAALALRRFRKAAGDLQRAQAAHAKALAEFTAAVASW